jgi:lipoate-protein ligase A
MDAYLVIDRPRAGAINMAIDQLLLERAAERQQLWLRVYRWEPATLSLGYFQAAQERRRLPLASGLPVVRRATGGGAIVHHWELTYSLCWPESHRLGASEALYCAVHKATAAWLAEAGWRAQLFSACRLPGDAPIGHASGIGQAGGMDGPGSAAPVEVPLGDAAYLCFQRRADVDLTVQGHKVLGSAQRRRSGGMLQHGSLLVAASPHAPELPGLLDLPPELGSDELGSSELAEAWAHVRCDRAAGMQRLSCSWGECLRRAIPGSEQLRWLVGGDDADPSGDGGIARGLLERELLGRAEALAESQFAADAWLNRR